MSIQADDLVDEVMRRSPRTIRAFLAFQLGCVGCPLACFHTVADACREHHIDYGVLLAALHDCAKHEPSKLQAMFRSDQAHQEG